MALCGCEAGLENGKLNLKRPIQSLRHKLRIGLRKAIAWRSTCENTFFFKLEYLRQLYLDNGKNKVCFLKH